MLVEAPDVEFVDGVDSLDLVIVRNEINTWT